MTTDAEVLAAFADLNTALATEKAAKETLDKLRKQTDEAQAKVGDATRMVETRQDRIKVLARMTLSSAIAKFVDAKDILPMTASPTAVLPPNRDQKKREGGK